MPEEKDVRQLDRRLAKPEEELGDNDKQIGMLRETGNEFTVENEEELLREEFGEPDEDGVYGADILYEETEEEDDEDGQ